MGEMDKALKIELDQLIKNGQSINQKMLFLYPINGYLKKKNFNVGVSCTIFHSALPSQIPSLFPLILPCSNVSGHSVTLSPPVTLRHAA